MFTCVLPDFPFRNAFTLTERLDFLEMELQTEQKAIHKRTVCKSQTLWTVPNMSITIIYNSTWSILIQWIRDILSGDILIWLIQKQAYFLFVINLIIRTKE